jgi:hypothetical protein
MVSFAVVDVDAPLSPNEGSLGQSTIVKRAMIGDNGDPPGTSVGINQGRRTNRK